jgi:heme O synthase-like polyprenyltransferase
VRFLREQSVGAAMALFRYSIVYLTLLFVAITADVLIRYR